MEGQSIKLLATVKSRKYIKEWTSRSTSGNLLGGVLTDDTGNVDFVCWNEAAISFDKILHTNCTYTISHVHVSKANSRFSKSTHACQLVFDKNSAFQVLTRDPFIAPINITPIAELLKVDDQQKCTVFGTITSMSPPEVLPNMTIQRSFLRDSTGIIQVSLIGDKQIKGCDYSVGNTVLFEETILRVFGPLRCLQGYSGTRQVNPVDRNLTQYLHVPGQPLGPDLSPARLPPRSHTLETLDDSSGRNIFSATILAVHLSTAVYDKCPRFQCNSRVQQLESGLFRCSKCGADYHVASNGLALNIEVGDVRAVPTAHKKLIMFNDIAQQFLNGRTIGSIAVISPEECITLVSTFVGKQYRFTVNPARQKGHFISDSFTKLSPSVISDPPSQLACVASSNTPTLQTMPLPGSHPFMPDLHRQEFISGSDYISFSSNSMASTSYSPSTPTLPTFYPSVPSNQDATNIPCQRELFPLSGQIQTDNHSPLDLTKTQKRKFDMDYLLGHK